MVAVKKVKAEQYHGGGEEPLSGTDRYFAKRVIRRGHGKLQVRSFYLVIKQSACQVSSGG